MQIQLWPILAEAGGEGFNFSGFQTSFHEAWAFIIPNAIMLLLCVATAKYVGKHTLPWLRLPWDRIRTLMQKLSAFLKDTGLFGSQFFPFVVFLAIIIAALDIFQVARVAGSNLI